MTREQSHQHTKKQIRRHQTLNNSSNSEGNTVMIKIIASVTWHYYVLSAWCFLSHSMFTMPWKAGPELSLRRGSRAQRLWVMGKARAAFLGLWTLKTIVPHSFEPLRANNLQLRILHPARSHRRLGAREDTLRQTKWKELTLQWKGLLKIKGRTI